MTASLLSLALVVIGQAQTNPSSPESPPGLRASLGDDATLFIPQGYRPGSDGRVDIVLHLHGAPRVIEGALVEARWPAVLIEFNRKGLSSVYTAPFKDRGLLPRLLEATLKVVREAKLADAPQPGKITVSAFSAGFGGVRELLKVPEHFERIDGLILADSLYAGYENGSQPPRVDPALMVGFRDFARRAANGSKVLVVTHSAQIPEGYASTTETADDLLKTVNLLPTLKRVPLADGWVRSREARQSGLVVLGFEGVGPEDHMRHLRRIADAWTLARELERDPKNPRP